MNVLVTGATGFLGKWLVRRLVEDGIHVRVLRRKSSVAAFDSPLVEDFWGDITDAESVSASMKDIQSVFHLAGHVGYSKADRLLMDKVNVQGTANVIAGCELHRVKRLVHMSSVVAVGASKDGATPLNEESPYTIGDLNLGYFETKRQAEELVMKSVREGKVDAVILNPSTIYGPGDGTKSSRKVQIKVAKGKFPFYTGGGVSIIGVHEVVAATMNAWLRGKTGERYILSGDNVTIGELFKMIAQAAGVEAPKYKLPNFVVRAIGLVGDRLEAAGKKGPLNSENAMTSILFHWFDSQKARRELGLTTRPAIQSIEQSVQWMKDNGILDKQ